MSHNSAEQVRSILADILVRHGYNPTRHQDWLLLRPELPAIGVSFFRDDAWHPSVSQVDFRILVERGVVIIESFGVTGATESLQAVDAIRRFSTNSLHVVLGALCDDPSASGHIEVLDLTAPDASNWLAFLSGWQLTLYKGTRNDPPPVIFDTLERLIKPRLVDGRIHWFRLSLSTLGGARTIEALWDNEPWSEAEDAVRSLDWASDNQQSARCFGIVRPKPPS